MALKSLPSVFLLVAIMVTTVTASQVGILGNLLGLIRIQGTVFCTPNGSTSTNGTTPVFPNARVQLVCGGNTISSATTNGNGLFSILLDPMQYVVSTLLSGCFLRVNTPLSSCDSSLSAAGLLQSTLQLVGSTVVGLLYVINAIPDGFQLVA